MNCRATVKASLHAAPNLINGEYPEAMVGFDDTAHHQWKADAWYGSNPYTFRHWIAGLVRVVTPRGAEDHLLFVNAWNEWAESAILELTTHFGRTCLLAVRNAVWS